MGRMGPVAAPLFLALCILLSQLRPSSTTGEAGDFFEGAQVVFEGGAAGAVGQVGALGVDAGEAGFHKQFGERPFLAVGEGDHQMGIVAAVVVDWFPPGEDAKWSLLQQP